MLSISILGPWYNPLELNFASLGSWDIIV